MSDDRYIIPVPQGANRRLAIAWLWLSVMALLLAGVFSVLLVLSRTPGVQDFFPCLDFLNPLISIADSQIGITLPVR